MKDFFARHINTALNFIFNSDKPRTTPEIPAPYTSQWEYCRALMDSHAAEFNVIAQRHNFQGHGIIFNRETGVPEFHAMLIKGDKSNISDIPKTFKDGLPIVLEYRNIAKG